MNKGNLERSELDIGRKDEKTEGLLEYSIIKCEVRLYCAKGMLREDVFEIAAIN